LALKHLAQVVVFVIDPTEGCGFPLSEQKHLLKEISNLLKVPVIIAINKADLATSDQLLLAQENSQNVVIISADKNDGIDTLVTMVGKQIK
jgi:nucleolar GTP-binding protein